MSHSAVRKVLLAIAVAFAVAMLALWWRPVPALPDGSLCGGRVYSWYLGSGTAYSTGENAKATIDAQNHRCRAAGRPLWEDGVHLGWAALVMGTLAGVTSRRARGLGSAASGRRRARSSRR